VEFIERLSALAAEVGVPFVEVVLLDRKENVLRRFAERGDPSKAVDAAELSTLYDRLVASAATRPQARIVHSGGIAETYERLLAALDR
jgi:hypothetical protein